MQASDGVRENLGRELGHAEREAWNALGRYKFQMFGYWAAIWVHLNRIGGFKRPNPFRAAVELAKGVRAGGANERAASAAVEGHATPAPVPPPARGEGVEDLLAVLRGIRERAARFATGDMGRPTKSATGACAWIASECDGALAKYGGGSS